jgi:hypothetical protein
MEYFYPDLVCGKCGKKGLDRGPHDEAGMIHAVCPNGCGEAILGPGFVGNIVLMEPTEESWDH